MRVERPVSKESGATEVATHSRPTEQAMVDTKKPPKIEGAVCPPRIFELSNPVAELAATTPLCHNGREVVKRVVSWYSLT